ncbi:MAG: hypothetical protein OXM58_01535 [Rhodospirillaceae bacterium]|nr:hypothetical protein [Rhodospirillaceae bacterium]MDE0617329.1 hypothetical protein [Rhodospirillaceae bacterium]
MRATPTAGAATDPDMHLHLYGRAEARKGRKMGHVTRLLPLGAYRAGTTVVSAPRAPSMRRKIRPVRREFGRESLVAGRGAGLWKALADGHRGMSVLRSDRDDPA